MLVFSGTGARFTARGAGLQPEVRVYRSRWRGLQVVAFYVVFSSTGHGLQPLRPWGGVYRSRRRGLQVVAFYVVFSSIGQGLQPEVRVYRLRGGVYRSRRRGLQVIRFMLYGFRGTAAGLQAQLRV